jgi:hypothetical protein
VSCGKGIHQRTDLADVLQQSVSRLGLQFLV